MYIASLLQAVAMLQTKTESRASQKLATLSAAMNHPPLREAGTAKVHQPLRAVAAKQNAAASDAHGAHYLIIPVRKKALPLLFLKRSAVLQSTLTMKKTEGKTSLWHSVLTTSKAMLSSWYSLREQLLAESLFSRETAAKNAIPRCGCRSAAYKSLQCSFEVCWLHKL